MDKTLVELLGDLTFISSMATQKVERGEIEPKQCVNRVDFEIGRTQKALQELVKECIPLEKEECKKDWCDDPDCMAIPRVNQAIEDITKALRERGLYV